MPRKVLWTRWSGRGRGLRLGRQGVGAPGAPRPLRGGSSGTLRGPSPALSRGPESGSPSRPIGVRVRVRVRSRIWFAFSSRASSRSVTASSRCRTVCTAHTSASRSPIADSLPATACSRARRPRPCTATARTRCLCDGPPCQRVVATLYCAVCLGDANRRTGDNAVAAATPLLTLTSPFRDLHRALLRIWQPPDFAGGYHTPTCTPLSARSPR